MIPKIIHYVWLGEREIPGEYRAYLEGWKKILPDWEFRFWNEKNFDFSASPYAREAYDAKKYSFTADYIRVCVLEQFGGVYLDTDVELLRPFPSELMNADFFQGFENDAYLETAVIGCMPSHPILTKLRTFYETRSFFRNGKPNLMPNPFFFTFFLTKQGLKPKSERQMLCGGKLIVAPREIFSPIDYTTGKDMRTAETIAVHHFANSWSGKTQRIQQRFLRTVRRVFGRRAFAGFTRLYVKSTMKKIGRSLKKT